MSETSNNKKISDQRLEWEKEVAEQLSKKTGLHYNDAAAMMETFAKKLDECWSNRVLTGDTADALIKAKAKTVFTVRYFDKEGEQMDQTQIDENSEALAWELFAEFGHTKDGHTLEIEPVMEEA